MGSFFTMMLTFCVIISSGQLFASSRELSELYFVSNVGEKSGRNASNETRCLNAYDKMTPEQLARYVDASGKAGSGIYGGNTRWFGSFSECNKQPDSRYCLTMFPGEITLVEGKLELPYLYWGVCIPSVCSKEDLINDLEVFLNISTLRVEPNSNKKLRNVECAQDPEYTTGVIFTIVLFGIILALCIFATVVELVSHCFDHGSTLEKSNHFSMEKELDEKSPLLSNHVLPTTVVENPVKGYTYEALNCFSVTRNINFVMKTDVGKFDLTYLHGIRVLTLFWVIYLHTNSDALKWPIVDNPKDVLQLLHRVSSMIAINGTFAVDTFFVLSGLLVVYVNSKKAEKSNGKIDWLKFYVHRFLRLTPSYMLVILFVTELKPFFGDGPLWFMQIRSTSGCSDNWWTNLLYINNFVHTGKNEMCMEQTWYLANDMQFFIISPILIIVGYRYGMRPFIAMSSVLIMASIITTASIIGGKDLNVNSLLFVSSVSEDDVTEYFEELYYKPYCRIQSYIVGMVVGFILFKYFSTKFKIHATIVIASWIVALGVGLALVYSPHNVVKENPHTWTTAENVIYGGLRWTLWSLCVSWVIFACHYGYAGIVKNILGAKFWIPLSRINYVAFLIHFDVINVLYLNIETSVHYTAFTQVTYYLAALVLCYAAAFIFTVVVELPFANLETLAWRNREKK